jgi:hypothetical protein
MLQRLQRNDNEIIDMDHNHNDHAFAKKQLQLKLKESDSNALSLTMARTKTVFLGALTGLELSQAFASGDVFCMPSIGRSCSGCKCRWTGRPIGGWRYGIFGPSRKYGGICRSIASTTTRCEYSKENVGGRSARNGKVELGGINGTTADRILRKGSSRLLQSLRATNLAATNKFIQEKLRALGTSSICFPLSTHDNKVFG